jgi:multidrug transporter EmrE-like cation transporter
MAPQFLFFTFLFAFLICKDFVFFKHQRIGRNEIIYGCLIGVPNFYSSKFILSALNELEAVIVYPSFSVATILVVTLVGVLAFKERLTKLQWLALAIILAALVLLNM